MYNSGDHREFQGQGFLRLLPRCQTQQMLINVGTELLREVSGIDTCSGTFHIADFPHTVPCLVFSKAQKVNTVSPSQMRKPRLRGEHKPGSRDGV